MLNCKQDGSQELKIKVMITSSNLFILIFILNCIILYKLHVIIKNGKKKNTMSYSMHVNRIVIRYNE